MSRAILPAAASSSLVALIRRQACTSRAIENRRVGEDGVVWQSQSSLQPRRVPTALALAKSQKHRRCLRKASAKEQVDTGELGPETARIYKGSASSDETQSSLGAPCYEKFHPKRPNEPGRSTRHTRRLA